ncbi:MAG: hypothetical protein KC588_07585 [Nitrospira sp.]|nr:hypothetical protein [Nitrospira sp.]
MNTQWVLSREEVPGQLDRGRQEYHESRPHRVLIDQTPFECARNYVEKDIPDKFKLARNLAHQLAKKRETDQTQTN